MPTFSDVHPGDPMNASNVQQVIDALKGTPGKGVPLAVTAVNDATNYALTVENLDATNSRVLSVLKSDGSSLVTVNASGVTLGSPLNLAAGAITTAAIANNAVTNAKLGTDTARLNLLTNGGFEIWQRGNGPFTVNGAWAADRWYINLTGTDTLSVSRDTSNVDAGSSACAACTYVAGSGVSSYLIALHTDAGQLRGKTVSLSIRVRTATANAVRVYIQSDGTGGAAVYSTYHTGGGTYQTLTVSSTLPSDATYVNVGSNFTVSCTAYIDNAMLVVGSVAADYQPLHPADDLLRCQRYYQRFDATVNANQAFASGTMYATTNGLYPVPLLAKMAGTPTLTISAPGNFNCTGPGFAGVACTAVSGYTLSPDHVAVIATFSGGTANTPSLLVANSTAAWMAWEFNP